jgi:hypothetical protein
MSELPSKGAGICITNLKMLRVFGKKVLRIIF